MIAQVVARFMDGKTVKGTSLDVDPSKPKFHVKTNDQGVVEVAMKQLKALLFGKDLKGNPAHNDASSTESSDPRLRGSKPVELKFRDGEKLVGLMNRFPPIQDFFFVMPVDAKSNNVRVLVNRAALV